ncbi:methyltransferase [Nocardia inohanensis]|uniref:methyltransferase n=1 Tax=Nocardia inohanensis TaxID=209246 RepID=UPI00082D706B|nr:class I SAM-dependent methyltransferase [Nocardia inohanensis]
MNNSDSIHWTENGRRCHARWRSENGSPPPARIEVVDDRLSAAAALRLANSGTAMLWRGDFHNASQLLKSLATRLDSTPSADFTAYRNLRSRRARILGMLLVELDAGHRLTLRRAPDLTTACREAYGDDTAAAVVSLRELQGVAGASEWRRRGVEVPALQARIHPHYGVFAPVRGEYVDLVARAPLPSDRLAFDIGTGTGVLAAVLARRGVRSIVATDASARALACARSNLGRLGYSDRVELVETDLYPPGRAPLVVCNPPWIPGKPRTTMDFAIYDPGSRMLRAFLDRLGKHLSADGEGWLVISDLAEHLGLRTRRELLSAFDSAGLRVVDRLDTRPRHSRVRDSRDSLHAARAAEVTSLWRLSADR